MFFNNFPFINEINAGLIAIRKVKKITNKFYKNQCIYYKKTPLLNFEIVTAADIEINKIIIDYISKNYPSDTIIGEEASLTIDKNLSRYWLVDPIDGTRSFIESKSGSSIMISFIYDDTPMFGIIYDIKNDNIMVSLKDVGIFFINDHLKLINKPLRYNKRIAWNPYAGDKLKSYLKESLNISDVIEFESSGLRALEIVKGNACLMISLPGSAKIWDTAPGFIMLNTIGGHYTDINGNTLVYSIEDKVHQDGAVASIGIDHAKILELLKTYLNSLGRGQK